MFLFVYIFSWDIIMLLFEVNIMFEIIGNIYTDFIVVYDYTCLRSMTRT